MSYIGNEPTSVAFLTDTFSGNGSTTAFTLSAAPATTSSILVAITGVLQDPSTYSVSGTTLTFSPAPPTGTSNISVRFLGIPASGVTTTAYRTVTEFTATSGQTTFSVPSYTVGFIDVYQNGVMLGSADYTASNGLSVVLAIGATVGDLIEVISFQVSSVLNAISAAPGSVGTSNLANSSVTMAKLDNTAQYTGFKNRLINGDMSIWQRGTSGFSSGQYGADRWVVINNTSASQNSDVPSSAFSFSFDFANSSASFPLIAQRIESVNCQDLVGQQVTVSAWVKNISGTANLFFELNYPNAKDNFSSITQIQTVTVSSNPSTSWTYYSATFNALPSQVANGLELRVVRNNASAAQTRVTGVQLERGQTATSFDYLPYTTELALCQRYYETAYVACSAGSTGFGGNSYWNSVLYKVQKRATATVTLRDAIGGSGVTIWKAATQYNGVSTAFEMNDAYSFQVVSTGSQTDAGMARFTFLASAEL
jgi:hypothetical protein